MGEVVVLANIVVVVVVVMGEGKVSGSDGPTPGEGRGSTAPLLHHGCMIPLFVIKNPARGTPCPYFLVSWHSFDWIEWTLPIAT